MARVAKLKGVPYLKVEMGRRTKALNAAQVERPCRLKGVKTKGKDKV